ncbi:hypothetical protein ACFFQF_22010 [Haladaptatus pallidirubidus]|uniref:Uncharacterized protein n=1 Tax=Haladaptatus pallidirubidus TaxID=1008152 RepID=A0AAV3UIM6_9EURY|nr:hypothetical protein [Haladaptatus pallidirubidus]
MPDALASVEDALDIPDDADNEEIADAVAHYREHHPVMNRLAGAREVYIESEHTTGNSQPSQTVRNVMQAVNEGKRCLLVSREQTARRVHTTLLKEPKGCHKNHSVDGEQRFYTLTGDVAIDGEIITRPGSSDNVWVYEESSGEYVLRDDNRTEHARFENAEAIFEDATAYPMGGDRSIKAPIIPDYDTDMLDIIVVKEDAKTPADLFLYRSDGDHVPLDMLATDDGEAIQTIADDEHSHEEPESEDDGGDIVDALR